VFRRFIVTAEAPTDKRKAIVEALMDLAAKRSWHEIEINDVAKAANVSLAEFRDLFPSKGAVLGALSRMIDRQVLEGPSASPRGNASSTC
jgi:AcrR family transcriptional regulator